jgi:hypothetical protein
MSSTTTTTTLVVLDSGCNKPENPLFSGRVFLAAADGSAIRPIVLGQSLPETVAVLPREKRLVWTAMGFPGAADGAVWTSAFDGTDVRLVVAPGGPLNTPKQICVDEEAGKMYVCDREGMQVIRCDLDGSNVEKLVSTGDFDDLAQRKDATRWCVGLAIDWEERTMYWSQKGK